MNSYLIDINAWLALSWGGHLSSQAALAWLGAEPKTKLRLLFCRITQLGLLQLLTNELVLGGDSLTIEDPRVEFATERHGLERLFREATAGVRKQKASKVLMDAYLIAFAGVEKATLVTFDKGMSKLAARAGVNAGCWLRACLKSSLGTASGKRKCHTASGAGARSWLYDDLDILAQLDQTIQEPPL